MQKLRSIQVLRGVAATAVVLCHAKLLPVGAAGVDVFFVISGFIIATVAPGRTAGQFLLDRAWRIYPVYWIAAAPWIVLAFATNQVVTERTLSSLTLWPLYSIYANPYLNVAWSLCFEMLFYVGAAWAIAARPILPLAVFGVCFVLQFIWPLPTFAFLGSPMTLEFLVGAALVRLPKVAFMAWPLMLVALAIFIVGPTYTQIGIAQPFARVLWWGIPSGMTVYAALSVERLFTRWADSFVLLGNASYSIYLWHLWATSALPWLFAVPLSIAFGIAFHRFVEAPLLSLRRHRHRDLLARGPPGLREAASGSP